MSGNRHTLAGSTIRSSAILGDGLTTNLRGVKNKFFDAMGGGFAYEISQDVFTSKVETADLNFNNEFATILASTETASELTNTKLNFSGAI